MKTNIRYIGLVWERPTPFFTDLCNNIPCDVIDDAMAAVIVPDTPTMYTALIVAKGEGRKLKFYERSIIGIDHLINFVSSAVASGARLGAGLVAPAPPILALSEGVKTIVVGTEGITYDGVTIRGEIAKKVSYALRKYITTKREIERILRDSINRLFKNYEPRPEVLKKFVWAGPSKLRRHELIELALLLMTIKNALVVGESGFLEAYGVPLKDIFSLVEYDAPQKNKYPLWLPRAVSRAVKEYLEQLLGERPQEEGYLWDEELLLEHRVPKFIALTLLGNILESEDVDYDSGYVIIKGVRQSIEKTIVAEQVGCKVVGEEARCRLENIVRMHQKVKRALSLPALIDKGYVGVTPYGLIIDVDMLVRAKNLGMILKDDAVLPQDRLPSITTLSRAELTRRVIRRMISGETKVEGEGVEIKGLSVSVSGEALLVDNDSSCAFFIENKRYPRITALCNKDPVDVTESLAVLVATKAGVHIKRIRGNRLFWIGKLGVKNASEEVEKVTEIVSQIEKSMKHLYQLEVFHVDKAVVDIGTATVKEIRSLIEALHRIGIGGDIQVKIIGDKIYVNGFPLRTMVKILESAGPGYPQRCLSNVFAAVARAVLGSFTEKESMEVFGVRSPTELNISEKVSTVIEYIYRVTRRLPTLEEMKTLAKASFFFRTTDIRGVDGDSVVIRVDTYSSRTKVLYFEYDGCYSVGSESIKCPIRNIIIAHKSLRTEPPSHEKLVIAELLSRAGSKYMTSLLKKIISEKKRRVILGDQFWVDDAKPSSLKEPPYFMVKVLDTNEVLRVANNVLYLKEIFSRGWERLVKLAEYYASLEKIPKWVRVTGEA